LLKLANAPFNSLTIPLTADVRPDEIDDSPDKNPKIAVEAHVELALKYLEEDRGLRIRTQSRLARSFIKRPKRSLRPWRYIMGLMTF